MTRAEKTNAFIQGCVAFGTIMVAILAIWGDPIRAKFVGPELELSLRSPSGFLTAFSDTKPKVFFYHLNVVNRRTSVPAKKVRILITQYEKKRADGSFTPEPMIARPQLTWSPMKFHDPLPTITRSDTCDLGYLVEGSDAFALSLYYPIPEFGGFIKAGEAMRVYVVASGDNFESESPTAFEINWNGKWSSDKDEMQRNLTVKEVKLH